MPEATGSLAAPSEKKLRIVQIGPVPPPHGGVSTNMLAIHKALLEDGHDSLIVDVTNKNSRPEQEKVIKPGSAFGLLKFLLGMKADVVHYHIGGEFSSRLAILTVVLGLLPRVRSIVTFHSGGFAKWAAEHARPITLRGLAFRSQDLLIAVNQEMLTMFRKYGVNESQCRLILPFELENPDPEVVVPQELQDFAAAHDPFLISVGALEPEYRNGEAIDAIAELRVRHPRAGLMIVGSGGLEAELRRRVSQLGLNDHVLLAGNVDRPVTLHLMQKADAMLRLTRYDGDSIAIREALYLGVPVIASDNAYRPADVITVPDPLDASHVALEVDRAIGSQIPGQTNDTPESGNARTVIEEYTKLLSR